MKPKHTPGPWINHGADGIFDCRTGGPSIKSARGDVICAVEEMDADFDDEVNKERMANARLIAAAPDLLKTCERLLAMYSDMSRTHFDLVEIGSMLAAVVAKARGGAK